MTQPENHSRLEFTNHAQDVRGEPINFGRDTKGRTIVLDPFQEPVVITDTRTGKTQTYPEGAGGAR